jgi:hypothetical protein
MKYLKTILLIAILSLSSSGCALYHHYGPYYGKILDAETKQPLEGAVVLAAYYTWLHASPGGPAVYFLDAQEVVSDKNGEFKIPSLNAFALRPISTFEPDPYFLIFKPRYKCYARPVPENKHSTIEMIELRTIKDRIANSCSPTGVPKRKMKKFIESRNVERINLGFEPIPLIEDER